MRLLRACAALLAGLVCAELGLRAAGWVYLERAGRRGTAEEDGRVLLCVGDSHVFGLYERPEDSYPAQLQALLDAHAEGDWRVQNRGRPGANSLDVVRSIDAELARARPAAVLATVGVNDEWTFTGSDPLELPDPPWYERLRLAKLARLCAARLGVAGQAGAAPGGGLERNASFRTGLLRDLRILRERCEAHGARLMLVAYATDRPACAGANALLRELARDEGFALCDASDEVLRLEAELGFERVFHLDLHPRAPGYRCVAGAAYEALRGLGIVQGSAAAPPDDGGPEEGAVRMRLAGSLGAPAGGPGELTLLIEGGEPGGVFQVILWGLRDAGAPAPVELGELERDPLLRATLNRGDLAGRFDGQGRAAVPLGPLLGAQREALPAGRIVQAGYLQHEAGDPRRVTRVPRGVPLELR